MTHQELQELLPAYALDAVAPEEARQVEAHLATCDECQRELARLSEIVGDLAEGVAEVAPPPALRTKILDAAQARPRLIVLPRWTGAVAVAAAGLLLVLAGIGVSLNQRLAALQQRLAAQDHVLALLAGSTAKTATLKGPVEANVRLVYDPARKEGALVVTDLRDPGVQFVYQLWLIAGTEPQSAGVFRPLPGQTVIVPVTADFSKYQAVAISVERGPGGVARPTAAPILIGTI